MKKALVAILTVPLLASCAFWRASGNDIYNTNAGNVGVGTANPGSKLTVVDNSILPVPTGLSAISSTISSPTNARAIYGAAVNTKGTWNYGGYFTAAGESSGVLGEASDPAFGVAGGVFQSYGRHGTGVLGQALNTDTTETNYGGWFDSRGPNGVGLYAKGGANGYAAQFTGRVQIGVSSGVGSTPATEMLSVNGVIESESGGIKFPDGTIQTTSAAPNFRRVTQLAEGGIIALEPEETRSVTAVCPQGMKAIGGGGGFHQVSGPIAILASHSYSGGTQWTVWFGNVGETTAHASLFVEAICATWGPVDQ